MQTFDCALRATRGAREYQEDTAVLWPGADASPSASGGGTNGGSGGGETTASASQGRVVAVLADGMGGHAGGALASRLVCEHFLKTVSRHAGETIDGLLLALMAANESVAAQVRKNPLLSGMGSTVIGVEFVSGGINWVSVGDSPLYLWRRGEIAMLNEDHSLAPDLDRLAAEGKITAAQARKDPRRHMLRSAVTGEEIDLVDISKKPLRLEADDYVILASDGLQSLELPEIERLVSAYATDGSDAVAGALIREIDNLREPHQDNATVVVVRAIGGDVGSDAAGGDAS
ncbi:MAG: protein phosphatase 2C domain-containing protein [Hyphomicrobium aestuarii]|nr:protein phosphatase 2C domain-containing protein [Hyphomicrobium aestuarii]